MVNPRNNLILKKKENKERVNVSYLWPLNRLPRRSRVMRERETPGGMNYGTVINEGVRKGEKSAARHWTVKRSKYARYIHNNTTDAIHLDSL